MNTQFDTSMAERPHPRQMSSNKVEHTAMQGESVAVNTLSAGAGAGTGGAGCTDVVMRVGEGVEDMGEE